MNEKARLKEIVSILKESNFLGGITPEKVCKTITKLGPTFIKIGQIMASRYDVLPKEYCDALSKLRSNVDPMPFTEVKKILTEELGNTDEIFEYISEKSIGSASMAQVHKAKLKTGEIVAIKVQRKNIYETMTMDVRLLKKAIILLHLRLLVKSIDLNSVLDEIYNVAKEEMNFEIEAKHLEEFRENNIDITYIGVPKIYKNYITKKVLVMDFIQGISLNEKQKLENAGYDIQEIGMKLANNYIKQTLDDGFFHADPHPNNITIKGDKIFYLDLGMMGKLSSKNKSLLKECMSAIIDSNYSKVASILVDMSKPLKEVDYSKLQSDIKRILLNYGNTDLNEINVSGFIKDFFNLLQSNYLVLDSDITMLIRGVGIIEAVLEVLDKNISLVEVLKNKIQVDAVSKLTSPDTVKKVGKSVVESTNSLIKLPVEVSNLITSLNDGDVKLKLELSESSKHIDKLEKLLHEAIITFIDGILIVCFCFSDAGIQKYILGLFILILSTILVIKMYIDHKHNGY